jgi:cell division protein FtsW (lipid II flippase)
MAFLGALCAVVVILLVLAVLLFLLGLLAYGMRQHWQRWQRAHQPFPEPYDAGCQRAAAAIAYDNGYWTTYRELGSHRIT